MRCTKAVLLLVCLLLVVILLSVFTCCKSNQALIEIVFCSNGGSEILPLTTSVDDFMLPDEPTKAGFVFEGWYLDSDFKVKLDDKQIKSFKNSGVYILYAKWTEKTHCSYSFYVDGLLISNGDTKKGSSLSAPASPSKAPCDYYNYVFLGWEPEVPNALFADMSFDAKFERVDRFYKVEFCFDDDVITSGNSLCFVRYGESATAPEVEKVGYEFAGWSNDIKQVKCDIIAQAVWRAKEYSLMLDSDFEMGTVEGAGIKAFGSTVFIKALPLSADFEFCGWFLQDTLFSTESEFAFEMPPNDIALIAKWKRVQYDLCALWNDKCSIFDFLFADVLLKKDYDIIFCNQESLYLLPNNFCADDIHCAIVLTDNQSFYLPLALKYKDRSLISSLDISFEHILANYIQYEDSDIVLSDLFSLSYILFDDYIFDGEMCLSKDSTVLIRHFDTSHQCCVPQNITQIGSFAFFGESALSEIDLVDTVHIGQSAFERCSNLCEVYANHLQSVGNSAFCDCSELFLFEYSTQNLISISNKAFENTHLSAFALGENIELGVQTFAFCSHLKTIDILEGIEIIPQGAFRDCIRLENIVVPSTVSTIQSEAFLNCVNLSKVVFSKQSSLTEIGSYAFSNCTRLQEIEIAKSVVELKSHCFYGCLFLHNVCFELPSSLATIENSAFGNCPHLEYVSLPNGTQKIEVGSFCAVKCVIVPQSVETVESGAFGVAQILCFSESKPNGWHDNWCDEKSMVTWGFQSTSYLGTFNLAFELNQEATGYALTGYYGSSETVQIVIPSYFNALPVVEIAQDVLKDLSVKSVILPSTIVKIGAGALGSIPVVFCKHTLPPAIENITNDFFERVVCVSQESYQFCQYIWGNEAMSNVYGGELYIVENELVHYFGDDEVLTIPDGVTSVAPFAFYGCNKLQEVNLPSSIVVVGSNAFERCKKLQSVVFQVDSVNLQIFDKAFLNCFNLNSITAPHCAIIADSAFENCIMLDIE